MIRPAISNSNAITPIPMPNTTLIQVLRLRFSFFALMLSIIKRIIAIKKRGMTEGEIETGDTSIIRDFVDVRDVVRAYYLLLTAGTSGEVYNICSGNAYRLADIINSIAEEVGVKIYTKVNPEFVRPDDNREIVGSLSKIKAELNWTPIIEFRKTITDMIKERMSF